MFSQARLPEAVREMSQRSSPKQTAGRMRLLLSITTNQIVACSNRASSIDLFSWSTFQMADGKVLFDMVCDRVLARFKFKNMKYLRKSVSLEKLENGR